MGACSIVAINSDAILYALAGLAVLNVFSLILVIIARRA